MVLSVHQPQYIPWLGYFNKIARSDAFVFLDQVQYKPREFQNRNKIRIKEGWIWLSVPVISKGKGRQRISDVMVDNEFPWARQHSNSLKSWYGGTGFFDEYFPFFENVYAQNWERLADLSVHIINFILEKLSITVPIYFESRLDITHTRTERIIEICRKLKADTYLSGAGGKDYLEEDKIALAGIKLQYQAFIHPAYHQRYAEDGASFIPYMSIIDLLFNEGKESINILRGKS